MRKLIIILPFLLFSCVTQQRCFEKYPIDTLRYIEYRDTIIPVYISSTDTIEKWGTIRDTLIVEAGSAHGMTWVIHDTLRLRVWQTDSTYIMKLDSAIKIIKEKDVIIREVQKKTTLDKINYALYSILGIGFIVLIIKLLK